MCRPPAHDGSAHDARPDQPRRAVVLGGDDVSRTIGRPGLLERTGAAEVVREIPTRFDVLRRRLDGPGAAPPTDLPASLRDWFQSMVSTDAGAEDVTLVVMSLHHELLGRGPWRHIDSGLLLEPPQDHEETWEPEAVAWLHRSCEPAGTLDSDASAAALTEVVDRLHTADRTVLLLTVSTFDPCDTAYRYAGTPDTYSVRAHRLIAAAQRLAMEKGIGLVDVDRAVAELGASEHVPAVGEFTDEAAGFITGEAISSFDEAALFGSSVQPDVMRLRVPRYDRRTERGRIARWHILPGTPVSRGDDLLDVLFEDLPLRVDHHEAGRDRRRPTTGRRRTRERSLLTTVVAASTGFVASVTADEGSPVAVGDTVAIVAPAATDRALSLDDAESDFRVATRRAERAAANRELLLEEPRER